MGSRLLTESINRWSAQSMPSVLSVLVRTSELRSGQVEFRGRGDPSVGLLEVKISNLKCETTPDYRQNLKLNMFYNFSAILDALWYTLYDLQSLGTWDGMLLFSVFSDFFCVFRSIQVQQIGLPKSWKNVDVLMLKSTLHQTSVQIFGTILSADGKYMEIQQGRQKTHQHHTKSDLVTWYLYIYIYIYMYVCICTVSLTSTYCIIVTGAADQSKLFLLHPWDVGNTWQLPQSSLAQLSHLPRCRSWHRLINRKKTHLRK